MTSEERMVEIGKILTERTEAKRDAAILAKRIQDVGNSLFKLAPLLMPQYPDQKMLRESLEKLNSPGLASGIDQIRKDIEDYLALQSRISSLSGTLKEIGAE